MKKKKLNCWEVKKCGREPGGAKESELGVCPTATCKQLNGIHFGKNGGRCCWVVAGSLCDGKMQGSFVSKFHNCRQCEFYKQVKREEGSDFQLSKELLKLLEKDK